MPEALDLMPPCPVQTGGGEHACWQCYEDLGEIDDDGERNDGGDCDPGHLTLLVPYSRNPRGFCSLTCLKRYIAGFAPDGSNRYD